MAAVEIERSSDAYFKKVEIRPLRDTVRLLLVSAGFEGFDPPIGVPLTPNNCYFLEINDPNVLPYFDASHNALLYPVSATDQDFIPAVASAFVYQRSPDILDRRNSIHRAIASGRALPAEDLEAAVVAIALYEGLTHTIADTVATTLNYQPWINPTELTRVLDNKGELPFELPSFENGKNGGRYTVVKPSEFFEEWIAKVISSSTQRSTKFLFQKSSSAYSTNLEILYTPVAPYRFLGLHFVHGCLKYLKCSVPEATKIILASLPIRLDQLRNPGEYAV